MGVNDVLRDFLVEQRGIRAYAALMLVFITMGGEEIGAVCRAIDGDFTLGAAADSTDLFGFGGAEALRFAFLANRTGHSGSQREQQPNRIPFGRSENKTPANHSLIARVERHGVRWPRRQFCPGNRWQAAGMVDEDQRYRATALHAKLQVYAVGGRIGVIEAPGARVIPARL